MITRSLGIDTISGLETIHHYDEKTDITYIEHKQDITAVINANKALHNTSRQRDGVKKSWVHAAIIPQIIQIKWMKEHGIKDIYSEEYWPKVRSLLNSPDYRYLKTGSMKV